MGFQRPLMITISSSLSCLLLLLSLLTTKGAVEGSSHHQRHGRHHLQSSRKVSAFQPTKVFVFGDSYADTGNTKKSDGGCWSDPYGITFPGKPFGRFSDGRVQTDYFAKTFGLKSPIPYQWRMFAHNYTKYGMNFAYGGTGVFDTFATYPNMTVQIDLLEQLIQDNTFSTADMNSSVTLMTVSGNDYLNYLRTNGTPEPADLLEFIGSIIAQLSKNMKRMYEIGARKVVVAALQPVGCLPPFTAASSFEKCNDTLNNLAAFHNLLLKLTVNDLNHQTASSTFLVLDLYNSFLSVLNNSTGTSEFKTPLTPCCVGTSDGNYCSSVDANGTKLYTVCEDPESAFFWDVLHPTQAGWRAVYSILSPILANQL